tara:strand:- start:2604 stop:3350 length:747 start_codon:yes stop_codon:yes gene_type:complete
MIKFFRKIRQNKLMKGQTTKYLKYGFGEIVLVVIGILIALQINNWNDSRKDRIFEVKMLTEIQKGLDSDISYFKRISQRLFKLDSASKKMIRLVHEKATFKDTLYKNGFNRWYNLRTGINYQYNPGPYEALKASGLDKLTNDSLRNSLINFYDFMVPRHKALVAYSDREYDQDISKLKSFLSDPFTELENGEVKIYSKFPEDLFLQIDFLELLRNINTRARISRNYIDRHIPSMENLFNQIKTEIEND